MPDRVTKKTRSAIMSSVGTRDTGPELKLRKALHRLGYRYRTNVRQLPGTPDLVFQKLKKVIFVHGCYWHGHRCRWGRLPKSRVEYWSQKILGNRARDARVLRAIKRAGWQALVVWQCEIRFLDDHMARITRFLECSCPVSELTKSRK